MAAPEGNQFYKIALANGNLNGRPALLKDNETLIKLFNEYLNYVENDIIYKNDFIKAGPDAGKIIPVPIKAPMTIEGFCLFCGITSQRLHQIEKDENYKDLFETIKYIRESIRNDQIKGGLVGTLNPMLVARIQGLKEQQELSGEVKNTVTSINFVQRSVEDATFTEVQEMIDNE